jgi:hypothetical protein
MKSRRPAPPSLSPPSEAPALPGAAWGNAALAEQVAQQGQEGAAGALPYRSQLEEAFGADLSFVRAQLGMEGPCVALGARAFAEGDVVVFREERPALQTVAHEVAHVLQQQGGPGPTLSASGAETDAEQAAAQVARGQTAQISGSASAGVYRDPEVLTGNPQLGTPAAGATRTWRPRRQEGQDPATGLTGSSRPTHVRILHDAAHPQRVVASPPRPVYQEDSAGTPVNGIRGSMTDPVVTLSGLDTPFIGDTPRPQDVHQGSIGSCWLLSAVLSAVRDDPGYVRGMFTGWTRDTVTVRLYRRDAATGAHVPVFVTVGRDMLAETRPGQTEPTTVGSGIEERRLVDSEWYAQQAGDLLEVHRRDRYEVASWASLLEKAYARFVEAHGQYGGAQLPAGRTVQPNRNADGSVRSGYDVLHAGGYADAVNEVLYGDRAVPGVSTVNTNFSAGSDLVRTNRAAIVALARGNTPGAGQSTDVSASLDNDTLRARVSLSLTQVLGEAWLTPHPRLRAEFAYLQILLRQRGSVTPARLGAYDREIEAAAAHATRPGAWPLLDGARAPRSASALRELLVDLQNSDNQAPRDQQMVLTRHAYPVVHTTFRDAAGAEVILDPGSPDAELPRIDGQRSSVRVRNPHGTDEPDLTGRGPADGADDGQFDLTLEQFLRNTGTLQVSSHRNAPPGTCSQ